MTHRHTITITIDFTETLAEAQRQGVVDMVDNDIESMLDDLKTQHGPDDAYGAPVLTKWAYTIDSEDTE